MAGKIIADIIEAPYDKITLNVGNTTVLTANGTGITYVPTSNLNINIGSTANLTLGNVTATSVITNGIKFPATQVASGDANTLDDYEEGTWTGTLKGTTSDPNTPVTATGVYRKIGSLVWLNVVFSNKTTTGAVGAAYVSGLPFAPDNTYANAGSGSCAAYNFDFGGRTSLSIQASTSGLYIYVSGDDTAWESLRHTAGTGRYLELSCFYAV